MRSHFAQLSGFKSLNSACDTSLRWSTSSRVHEATQHLSIQALGATIPPLPSPTLLALSQLRQTSVRLLLNVVENVFYKNEPEGCALVLRILQCLVAKLATLHVQIPKQAISPPPPLPPPSLHVASPILCPTTSPIAHPPHLNPIALL